MPVHIWVITVPLAIGILLVWKPVSELVTESFGYLFGTNGYDTDQGGRDA